MSVYITKYPDVEVSVSPSKISKWSSVHHPIKFGLTRRDFEGISFLSGSNYSFKASDISIQMSDFISSGERLYFETPNNSGTILVTATTGSTVLGSVINSTSESLNENGFVNLYSRANFFTKTRIYSVDSENVYKEIGVSINKVDTTGRTEVDVSSFLKSLVGYEDNFKYNVLNERDLNLGGRYNITVSENWNGHEGSFSGISQTSLRYFVNSVKQIQDIFGSNMGEYVPFAIGSDAKFLSDFKKPTYFEGYPYSLDFIYGEDLNSFEITKREQRRDQNGVAISPISTAVLDHYGIYGVNRLTLSGGYAANIKTVEVWLEKEVEAVTFDVLKADVIESGYFIENTGLQEISAESIRDEDGAATEPTHIFTEAFTKAFA